MPRHLLLRPGHQWPASNLPTLGRAVAAIGSRCGQHAYALAACGTGSLSQVTLEGSVLPWGSQKGIRSWRRVGCLRVQLCASA